MKIQKSNSTMKLESTREIKIGKIYKHYSGKLYKVISIARDSEEPNCLRVVYQGMYDCPQFGPNPIWVRPYSMFAENVLINGNEQPRFQELDYAK